MLMIKLVAIRADTEAALFRSRSDGGISVETGEGDETLGKLTFIPMKLGLDAVERAVGDFALRASSAGAYQRTRGDAWLARKMLLETTASQRAYDARSHGMKEPPGRCWRAISWGNGGFHGSADGAFCRSSAKFARLGMVRPSH